MKGKKKCHYGPVDPLPLLLIIIMIAANLFLYDSFYLLSRTLNNKLTILYYFCFSTPFLLCLHHLAGCVVKASFLVSLHLRQKFHQEGPMVNNLTFMLSFEIQTVMASLMTKMWMMTMMVNTIFVQQVHRPSTKASLNIMPFYFIEIYHYFYFIDTCDL